MKRITQLPRLAFLTLSVPVILLTSCNRAPKADFEYEVDGAEVTFTFSGDGEVDEYEWDFGDGSTSDEENPIHTFTSSGDFPVTLTVSNDKGDDSKTETVTIEGGTATNPELSFSDADGAFYAINTNTVQDAGWGGLEITIAIGTAVAWFQNGGTFVEVGDVKWNQGSDSETLDFNESSTTYSWVELEQPSEGFNNDGISWNIDGGNSFPAIGGTGLANLYPFPSVDKIDEDDSAISGDGDYILRHDGYISNADSVYFSIYGPDGHVLKRMGGGTTRVEFTSSEMESVGEGNAILRVAGFNIQSDESTGKKFYMINESVASKTVTIE